MSILVNRVEHDDISKRAVVAKRKREAVSKGTLGTALTVGVGLAGGSVGAALGAKKLLKPKVPPSGSQPVTPATGSAATPSTPALGTPSTTPSTVQKGVRVVEIGKEKVFIPLKDTAPRPRSAAAIPPGADRAAAIRANLKPASEALRRVATKR